MKLIANRIDTAVTQLMSGFARDTRGAVALMLGLAAVPVILAAGAAVDFFRIEAARAELEGKNVKLIGPVFEYGAVKLAAFEDLNGNVLQIYEHVR